MVFDLIQVKICYRLTYPGSPTYRIDSGIKKEIFSYLCTLKISPVGNVGVAVVTDLCN